MGQTDARYELVSFNRHLYPMLESWWVAHEWDAIPLGDLPTVGMLVYNKEEKKYVCAAFLYRTDSVFAIMDFFVSNPDAKNKDVYVGFDLVIETLTRIAKQGGHSRIFSSVESHGLIKKLESNGFIAGDTNMTNLVRIV